MVKIAQSLQQGHRRYANVVGACIASEQIERDKNSQEHAADDALNRFGEPAPRRSPQACYRWCHTGLTGVLAVATVFFAWHYYKGDAQNHLTSTPRHEWAPLPAHDSVIYRIGFGSCAQQQFAQPFWDSIVGLNPDLFIYAGDTVYGDCLSDQCSELSAAFRRLQRKPSFAGAKGLLPMVAIWDDHDYGQNDGAASNPYKNKAKQIFIEFFGFAAHDDRRTRPGLYNSYLWGPPGKRVQVILLDTRWFRSAFSRCEACNGRYAPDMDASKTMLGAAQWSWLRNQLLETADVRLLVSTIQVVADGHSWEGWSMLPRERERLYELLSKTEGTTVILSGDRHVGGFYKSPTGVVEVTSSSLTHAQPLGMYSACNSSETCDEIDIRRMGPFVRTNHFGIVEIDWNSRLVTIGLNRAANADGHVQPGDFGLAGEVLRSYNVSIAN